ncbi:MAG: hypothetical protein JW822_13880 [Spirochaetales bacterium]|nr:hypothetical protein [Spirochaetales bacterium]
MKKLIFVFPLLIIIMFFIPLSCDLLGVSISGRVDSFVNDLNKAQGDRNLRGHFHTDMQNRALYDENSFEATPLSWNYDNFTISLNNDEQDMGGGVTYQSGVLTKTGGGISPDTIKFYFQEEEEGVWYILAISVVDEAETWGNTAGMP